MKALRFAATVVAAFGIYLLLAAPLDGAELLLGAGTAIVAGILVSGSLPVGPHALNPLRILRALVYLPVFVWKMILANLQIAAIVIKPRIRVSPAVVKGRTESRTAEGRLILTSSITLTPGTLTLDTKHDEVFVHWVTPAGTDDQTAEREILRPFETHIKGIAG